MCNLLNVQFSIFGDFSKIKANTQNIFNIMQKLENQRFLPNTITSQNIDIVTKKVQAENRISFITQDQSCNFVIFSERIDVTYDFSNIATEDCHETFKTLKLESIKIFEVLFQLFEIKSNRLALNVKVLGNKSISNEVKEYYNTCINGLSFYKDKDIFEWGYNTNARIAIDINSTSESLNIITNFGMARNINNQDMRLICHFDINTLGENISARFGNKEFEDYINTIEPILLELIENFKGFENNE